MLFINLMEIFKAFFRMSLISDLNMNNKWLINLLEVKLKTQLDRSIPEEKQESQAGKNYTKHYLWQRNFHLYMWKCITKEVNYHYYHFPFRLVSLVLRWLYNSTEIQGEKQGKEPVSLNICLFVSNLANHEKSEWNIEGNEKVAISTSQQTCQNMSTVASFS